MAFARVVAFEGVDKDRIEQLKREMQEGEPPEGFPAAEMLMLHDAENDKSLVLLIFETEDEYRVGDEFLNAMPTGDTPGRRTSVTKYDVALRMTPTRHLTTLISTRAELRSLRSPTDWLDRYRSGRLNGGRSTVAPAGAPGGGRPGSARRGWGG